jgi:transposase
LIEDPEDGKETAMKSRYENVTAVGMDVHYKFSTVTMRDAQAKVVCRERLEHRDRGKLREALWRWPREVPVVMEASFGWGWLADLLKEEGLRPELSNCFKVEQMRKARGLVKTNQKDADLLSLLPYEAGDWWKVWMAPPEVRDQRETMRYRSSLVGVQTETKNRVSGLLQRHGVVHDFSDLFGVVGWRFLAALSQEGRWDQGVLWPGALAGLRGLLELLEHLRGQLARIARELRGPLEATPLVRRLDGIPGIGMILAHTVRAEIGVIERFRDSRALASYSLLAPISDETGEATVGRAPLGRHLGHRGNRTLKWAFLEAAHGAVKRGGKWRRIFDAATEGGRKNRNRGYIQVARELVKVVYVVWKKNVEYTDTPPARPGRGKPNPPPPASRERAREFFGSPSTSLGAVSVSNRIRSGTGQPSRPMGAVR